MKTYPLLLVWAAMTAAVGAATRPNIVFIFSDDHTTQAISAYQEGRHLIDTPNIDRLAREGMRFDRCLVPNPICGPSRAIVLTGKYSHLNGFYNNINCTFDGSQPTFPKMLQQAGYQTALIGKWHLESDPTGFDEWNILPGQGFYFNPPMIRNGVKTQNPGYVTDVITDHSIDWLQHRDRTKPFLLMMQHKAPHAEWSPALRHLGWDHDRHYPEPATLFDQYDGDRGVAWAGHDLTLARDLSPRMMKFAPAPNMTAEQLALWEAYYGPRNEAFEKAGLMGDDLVRWRYQRYLHDFLGTIKSVDESVGRVLDALEAEGLADNTIVIFSSDQGVFLGEHGWFDKRWVLEESARTPLLVRWPGRIPPASTNDALVSTLDFAQTLLEVAGLPQPGDMQGHSLVPLLRGEHPRDWRTSLYYHYYQATPVLPHEAVITKQYKFVHYYAPDGDDWELYDLTTNPSETINYFHDPAYQPVVKELSAELTRLRTELKVPASSPPEAHGKKPFLMNIAETTPASEN